MGPRTKNLLRTRFVSHIAKILCLYKQNIEGKRGQTKPYLYLSSDIYYGHAYKEAIYSTAILATLKSKPTAKRKETVLSSLSNADICDGEDYIIVIS
jgi:hypothetical protein